jgi:hypothetical protein
MLLSVTLCLMWLIVTLFDVAVCRPVFDVCYAV